MRFVHIGHVSAFGKTAQKTFSPSRPSSSARSLSSMAQTYEAALERLAALQSNKAVTSLFSPPAPSSSPASTGKSTASNLNALAIPEMKEWLGRAGIATADLGKLKCVHVAGTKGKGSVCAYLTAILTQKEMQDRCGRVGTYTSPHLVSVRERIMLDGRPISQELFARYFFEVWDAFTESARVESRRQAASGTGSGVESSELEGPATKPFYFRFLTILAFHVFLREGVRSAVVECGIGGEYDSTNVLPSEAVTCGVVSQLGIDHVGMLGRTLPEIAWHKIGIAKPGRAVFTRRLSGEDGESAMKVMRARTQENSATLVEVPDEDVESWDGPKHGAGALEGRFQKYNQALAVCAANEHVQFLTSGPSSSPPPRLNEIPDIFTRGLSAAWLRGRCETITETAVSWLIDGAHTAESLVEVANWFASKRELRHDAEVVLLFNQQDRDAPALLRGLYGSIAEASDSHPSAFFHKAVFTRNDLERSADGEPERDVTVQEATAKAMKELSPHTQTVVRDNVADAIEDARNSGRQAPDKRVVVLATGSLHLVGALIRTLEPDAPV